MSLLAAVSAQVADFVVTHEALEEHRDRFQAVLDNRLRPCAKDAEGRYLFVNRRFEECRRREDDDRQDRPRDHPRDVAEVRASTPRARGRAADRGRGDRPARTGSAPI
jgi:PAS domain-containing protein